MDPPLFDKIGLLKQEDIASVWASDDHMRRLRILEVALAISDDYRLRKDLRTEIFLETIILQVLSGFSPSSFSHVAVRLFVLPMQADSQSELLSHF